MGHRFQKIEFVLMHERNMEVVALIPDDSNARNNLRLIYQAMGELDVAKEEFVKSIELDGNFADPHFNLGNLFIQEGDIETAFRLYNAATNKRGNVQVAYYNLGIVYEKLGVMDMALLNFQKAHEIAPDCRLYIEKLNEYD